jgi:hypothetical protein
VSQSASQAAVFYREVARSGIVFSLRDDQGYPTSKTSSGAHAIPFWSSGRRVERIIATVPAYASFEPVEITWDDFRARWVAELESDQLLVGVNWSGRSATGYDVEPGLLVRAVETAKRPAE